MKIQQVEVGKIKVGSRFREDLGDLTVLTESIKEKGVIQPITISDEFELVAGGRRLAAAEAAGLVKIPSIIRKLKNEVDGREIELIENVARKDFSWHERAKLEKRIFDLKKEEDPEWSGRKQAAYLDKSTGATARRLELANMMEVLPELQDEKTEKEAWKKWKELEEAVVVQSLIEQAEEDEAFKDAAKWAKKHYKIGNAITGLQKVEDSFCNFIEVDPPYGIELNKRKDRNQDLSAMDKYNEVVASKYPAFLMATAKECHRILGDHGFMVWWFGMEWYQTVYDTLVEVGFKVNHIPGIWTKGAVGQTASPDTILGSSYEPFFVARKGKPKLKKLGRSNVFHFEPVPPQNKIHPTERPLALMEEILNTFAFPRMMVCVPFLGSGVTLRAVYKNKMGGFGWDLDELTRTHFVNQVYKDQTEGAEEDDPRK